MPRSFGVALAGLISLSMLLTGWQLGARYEAQRHAGENGAIAETGSGQTVMDPQEEIDMALFWRVWGVLLDNYIEPSDLQPREMFFGAISGMVDGVGDPYTAFMPPQETEDFEHAMHGELEGIGAELEVEDGYVVVVAPIKGSPAERAGLRPQDVIAEVDGEEIYDVPLTDVITKIRGPKGTRVELGVAREGETELLTMTIVRDEIKVPSVEWSMIEDPRGAIGVLTLNQFGADTTNETEAALLAMKRENPAGIVIDLRGNGGGYLDGAVDLASFFIESGKVVSVESREGPAEHHYASGDPLFPNAKLVVLVNGGSASASEIVAGTLQDMKRATMIGTQTFGKGTVQEVVELPMRTSLRVTVARWVTSGGRHIDENGLTPDIVVEMTEEDRDADRDPQLEAAVEFLTTGKVTQ